jgi:uncharacterized membrane protein
MNMMYQYHSYGLRPEFGVFHLVGHAIGIAILILLVLWFIRRLKGSRGHWHMSCSGHSGLTILNERYARGEIETAEYEERKKTLLK